MIILCSLELFGYDICTGTGETRSCKIYSPSNTTSEGSLNIDNNAKNVILYCICMVDNSAVGPTTWFFNNAKVNRTTDDGLGNPYYRDNVPSPLIIPSYTPIRVGTYGCGDFQPTMLDITINLTLSKY